MRAGEFFDSPEKQSLVKAELVDKYFGAWARVILNQRQRDRRIAFADLFSGPGAYYDGTPSTPLQLLTRVIHDEAFRQCVVAVFNDLDSNLAESLRKNIDSLPGVETLSYPPQVLNLEVDDDVLNHLSDIQDLPSLFFIDPFGYKGLSLDLIGSAIQGWGSECVIFFNYNRINPGLTNPVVTRLMTNLFGEARLEALRRMVGSARTPSDRERLVVDEFKSALRDVGGKYVAEFKFRNKDSDRTSHYIFHATKNPNGHRIMKEVMYGLSTDSREVRRAEFAPPLTPQLALFPEGWEGDMEPHSLRTLKSSLCVDFAGQSLTVSEVCNRYTTDEFPYIRRNVKSALLDLEIEGLVLVNPPLSERIRDGKPTLADHLIVTFN